MKVRDIIKALEADGWVQVSQESSHRNFKKEGERNVVTVAGQDSKDVAPGQLQDIRRKSGLTLR